jgi:hypothetical protein
LEGKVADLSLDSQGTHLIQKLVGSINAENIGFIYYPVIGEFVKMANHQHGLCVLKQIMTKVESMPKGESKLNLKMNIVKLLRDNLENII